MLNGDMMKLRNTMTNIVSFARNHKKSRVSDLSLMLVCRFLIYALAALRRPIAKVKGHPMQAALPFAMEAMIPGVQPGQRRLSTQ
ncbi:hypothetical protein Sbs19_31280 [Sphingobium sp. BS19]|nr:hypothetical protein Sbs19_31280 [Sphingobium sp. BS19]